MDDVVVLSNDISLVTDIKFKLHDMFKIKDLGVLKYFLRLEVARSIKGLHICQKIFILDLLKDYGFLELKFVVSPMTQD